MHCPQNTGSLIYFLSCPVPTDAGAVTWFIKFCFVNQILSELHQYQLLNGESNFIYLEGKKNPVKHSIITFDDCILSRCLVKHRMKRLISDRKIQ